MGDFFESSDETFAVQTLVVVSGPFAGRICENDDDEFFERSEFSQDELAAYDVGGVQWKKLRYQEYEGGPFHQSEEVGSFCEFVSFGYYLHTAETFVVPRQALRAATMNDLVVRSMSINHEIMQFGFNVSGRDKLDPELISLQHELIYIMDQIWSREKDSLLITDAPKRLFLCHSSADKPFVRQVYQDLIDHGHVAWFDEFEIKAGDSIVDKIDTATQKADALILFISKASVEAPWVKREWQSTLMRQLADKEIKILPALIEDAKVPNLLSDIRYADFRESYLDGLRALLSAL